MSLVPVTHKKCFEYTSSSIAHFMAHVVKQICPLRIKHLQSVMTHWHWGTFNEAVQLKYYIYVYIYIHHIYYYQGQWTHIPYIQYIQHIYIFELEFPVNALMEALLLAIMGAGIIK